MKKKEKESKNRKSFAIIWEISLERKGLHGLFFRVSYKSVRAMNVECSPTVSKISNSFVLRRQQKNIIQGSFNIEVIATRNISNRGSKVSRVIIYSPFIIGGNGAEKSLFHHVCILKRSSSRYGGYFHLRNNLKKIFTFFFFFFEMKETRRRAFLSALRIEMKRIVTGNNFTLEKHRAFIVRCYFSGNESYLPGKEEMLSRNIYIKQHEANTNSQVVSRKNVFKLSAQFSEHVTVRTEGKI